MINLPQCRGLKISCCNIFTPWGRNIMARVNILYLNVRPWVLILYNKFTRGCSYWRVNDLVRVRTRTRLLTPIYTVNLFFQHLFPSRATMTSENESVLAEGISHGMFPRAWSWTCRKYCQVPRHSEKDSSKQIRFLCDYNFVGWCNFIINLYIQQQYIDSLSSKGWFIIISHQALLCFFSGDAAMSTCSMRVCFTS